MVVVPNLQGFCFNCVTSYLPLTLLLENFLISSQWCHENWLFIDHFRFSWVNLSRCHQKFVQGWKYLYQRQWSELEIQLGMVSAGLKNVMHVMHVVDYLSVHFSIQCILYILIKHRNCFGILWNFITFIQTCSTFYCKTSQNYVKIMWLCKIRWTSSQVPRVSKFFKMSQNKFIQSDIKSSVTRKVRFWCREQSTFIETTKENFPISILLSNGMSTTIWSKRSIQHIIRYAGIFRQIIFLVCLEKSQLRTIP